MTLRLCCWWHFFCKGKHIHNIKPVDGFANLGSWLLSSLSSASSTGSDPFTHVYTMSIGSSGHKLNMCMHLSVS